MKNKKIKLVGLDLDGTITQHKSKLNKFNKEALDKLSSKYQLVIVGAGSCERIYKQLKYYKIDIIGNYGMEKSNVIINDGLDYLNVYKKSKINLNKDNIDKRIENLREIMGYSDFLGNSVEFHESGLITFPLLGTEAQLNDKLKFDADRKKRRKYYNLVQKVFSDFNVFIGGTSSFDIVPKEFNKYNALIEYAKSNSIEEDEIIYFGDDYGIGGNDEDIMKSKIRFIKVDSYLDFPEKVRINFNN